MLEQTTFFAELLTRRGPSLLLTNSSSIESKLSFCCAFCCLDHTSQTISTKRRSRSWHRVLSAMAPPQDSSNHTRLGKRRRYSADGASSSRASSSALLETGELVGDTQTPNDVVSEEPSPQREAPRAPLQAEGRPPTALQAEGRPPTALQAEGRPPTALQAAGRPPTALQAEGRPPTGAKWNFNLESDTPGALLPIPPVAADLSILERLPSDEPGFLIPELLIRRMEKCVRVHRHDMVD